MEVPLIWFSVEGLEGTTTSAFGNTST